MTWFHVESINYPSTKGTPLQASAAGQAGSGSEATTGQVADEPTARPRRWKVYDRLVAGSRDLAC